MSCFILNTHFHTANIQRFFINTKFLAKKVAVPYKKWGISHITPSIQLNKCLYFHLYTPILSTFSLKTNTYIPERLKRVKKAYSGLDIKEAFIIFAK